MVDKKLIDIEKLSRYHENLNAFLTTKQDVLNDIDDIRSGAAKGATALQSVPADYAKKSDIPSIEYCTNDDIYRLFNTNIPETPDVPEQPSEIIGSIANDNSIVIDEAQLENGTYTLRYIDSNDNIIDNFNEITSFEINK